MNNRKNVWILIVSALTLVSPMGVRPAQSQSPATIPAAVPNTEEFRRLQLLQQEFRASTQPAKPVSVQETLQKRFPRLDFENVDFETVVQYLLQGISGMNINVYVNWQTLQAAGIEKTAEVNVHLKNVTFEKALRVILANVGGTTPLSFAVDDNVLTISTKDDLSQKTAQTQTRQVELRTKLVTNMKETCENPQAMSIIAVGGLRSDVAQKPAELIADLESLLGTTKSLATRNAIRLTLKDLYAEQGQADKVKEQLKAMIQENDAALQGVKTDTVKP